MTIKSRNKVMKNKTKRTTNLKKSHKRISTER